ncbi:MAG: WxL domain-containing protein [Carnobacterium sp.]|uniref:WxL domain-containing protein n=1 Tax=Carnobacterium sp. TaxID=48221 RepID=UPI002FC89862
MKSFKLVTLGAVLVSSMAFGTVVQAAVEGGTYNSKAEVTFEEDNESTAPVDPIDPEKPVKPIDPVDPEGPTTGTPGPLSIDFASSLQFGKNKIKTTDQTYFAKAQEVEENGKKSFVPLYAQVTDKRSKLTGWNLSVKQEGQFKTITSAQELKGAVIKFSGGVVNSAVDPVDSVWPTIKNSDFSLDADGSATTLLSANDGAAFGTYLLRFGDKIEAGEEAKYNNVSLDVPGKSVKVADEAYRTKLNWELKNVPGNGESAETEKE